MLREEQAAELLRRCEVICCQRLDQVRGNLRKAGTRAAAIWELLVIEEVSRIGDVQYECVAGGGPDVLLNLPDGSPLWVEAAFLYPRFWKTERVSDAIETWVVQEAKKRGIPPSTISCYFNGDRDNPAGPVRELPFLHQSEQFLRNPQVAAFFAAVCRDPARSLSIQHGEYSVRLTYTPDRGGSSVSTGGGLVQEVPRKVKEHAVYRVLREKARQHNVSGPKVIFVGSDQNRVVSLRGSLPWGASRHEAVNKAFSENTSLSAVYIVSIEYSSDGHSGSRKIARCELLVNSSAKAQLRQDDVELLSKLAFNRWKYTHKLDPYEPKRRDFYRRVGGHLSMTFGKSGVELEVPASVLMDSLAGRTSLIDVFAFKEGDPEYRYLKEGWMVKSCSWKEGNIEQGEAPKVVLGLSLPPQPVFWPKEPIE